MNVDRIINNHLGKIVMLIVIFILWISFVFAKKLNEKTTQTQKVYPISGTFFTVRVIDGCEYIRYDRSLTHKGNCTNAIHHYESH